MALALIGAFFACGDAAGGNGGGNGELGVDARPPSAEVEIDAAAPLLPARRELPVVLLHGMIGFDNIGPLDYYYDVVDSLREDGHQVFVTQVDPLQRISVRAASLHTQIDAILEETGAEQVHLVGHSQGGLDARYLVSTLRYGEKVATVTTIASPHRGSRVADVALGILPGPSEAALGFLANFLVGGVVGSEQDLEGQVYNLTEEYMVGTFEVENPDDPRVQYFSVAGKTQLLGNPFSDEICDPLLVTSYNILRSYGDNDGMVSVESATRGTLLGVLEADHLDEVGQLLGSTAAGFDHRKFYRDLLRFLTDENAPAPL